MSDVPDNGVSMPLAQSQLDRLHYFGATQCVDIHCHILPGIDDGPANMADAVALCRGLVADGITTAIATPHQLGRYDGSNSPTLVRAKAAELRAELRKERVPLTVKIGADVRIDERLADLLDSGQILPLAEPGRYVLLEFSHDTYMDPARLLDTLVVRGWKPIISHPERHNFIQRQPNLVLNWLKQGASLQITAASIVGAFGPVAEKAAWHWLNQGLVQLVATDAHNLTSRKPMMSAAADLIATKSTRVTARRICFENPSRVLQNQELVSVRTPAGVTRPAPKFS